jgi:uncharacterized phosphosugar-binding protein
MGLGDVMREHLAKAEAANSEPLDAAAELLAERVSAGGLVFVGGSGHSLGMVMEGFYRAGGLACVYPLYDPSVLPLTGAPGATLAERRPGLGASVMAAAEPRTGDVAVIFSNSGTNPYPVELAVTARAAGLPVIAFVSGPSSAAAPARADRRLDEVADLVVDTLVPAGDAAYPPEAPRTAPLSSLVCIYLWNLLLARPVMLAGDLPLWVSSNMPGGDRRNAELIARYSARVPALR